MGYCQHCGGQVPDGAAVCPRCYKPPSGPPAAAKKGISTGVWVLLGCGALLFLLAVGGIVAAIFVPNFLDALQKARQKRAIMEMQAIGQAIEAYKAEHEVAPAATDVAGLAAALGPPYSTTLARLDPWQHPFRYSCWRESPTATGCDHYRLACAGRDGAFEQQDLKAYAPDEFDPVQYDRDIVFGDGAFITRPRPR